MTLLIVDDEFYVRERILQQMQWHLLGIERVEDAESGREALQKCKSVRPDILLTDIKMPTGSGFELAAALLKQFPNIKVIFISGYSDKEYLKTAITLRAVRYIEKPINMDELHQTILETVKLIRDEQWGKDELAGLRAQIRYKEMQTAALLLTQKNRAAEAAPYLRNRMPELDQYRSFVSVVIKLTSEIDEDFLNENMMDQIVSLSTSEDEIILCAKKHEHVILHFFRKPPNNLYENNRRTAMRCNRLYDVFTGMGVQVVFGVGVTTETWEDLSTSFESAVVAVQKSFYCQPGCICLYHPVTSNCYDFSNFQISEFEHALSKSSDHAVFLIRSLTADIKRFENTLPAKVIRLYFSMIQSLLRLGQKENCRIYKSYNAEQDIWDTICRFCFLDQLSDFLIGGIREYGQSVQSGFFENTVVNRIIRYIQFNYADPGLCVTNISEYLKLSPTYICHLFKDITNITIINYVTNYRIDKSKELLATPEVKLKKIAHEVGYRNENYFSYLFKAKTGCSPTKYRERVMK